jgi:AcrR family transcriptional regulator
MQLNQTNTRQAILDMAEKLFIEKGFEGAKMMEIAKVAGVNHAMLHYYFQTKENLFNQIFDQKASQLLGFFVEAFNRDDPFFEKLKIGIETHFDFLSQTPELPLFVLSEIAQDKERKQTILQKVFPVGQQILKRMAIAIDEEVNKGTIRSIKPLDLLLNIASLNVFAFVAAQVFFDIKEEENQADLKKFLAERKKNNVDVIINSIKL